MMKNQRKSICAFILSLAWVFFCVLDGCSAEVRSSRDEQIKVTHISDGDSLVAIVDGRSEKIRLIGIDAPELDQRPWGKRARKHLESLVKSSSWSLSLEYDVDRRDRHGRILGYLRGADGRLLNEEMLRDGFAVLFTFPPNVRHVTILTEAQRQARESRVGIWGKDGLREKPVEYRKKHPRTD